MNIILIILAAAAAYFLLAFVGLRLVAPFMGFRQYGLPKDLPQEISDAIKQLENASTDQKTYLDAAYNFIMQKNQAQWGHSPGQAAVRLPRLFLKDLKEIWDTRDFVYCTAINYVLYTMLVSSKVFKEGDVKVRHVFVNFVPHQYLEVNIGGNWVDVDPAGAGIRGRPLGSYLSGFG